jgi:hypothetical protein
LVFRIFRPVDRRRQNAYQQFDEGDQAMGKGDNRNRDDKKKMKPKKGDKKAAPQPGMKK